MTNIEKERLVSEKLVEILNKEPEDSVLFNISPKILRRLINEGINIAEEEFNKFKVETAYPNELSDAIAKLIR